MTDAARGQTDLMGMEVAAPLDAVLVLEDRAQVTRRGKVTLKSGEHTLLVRDVTPLIVDRSVRIRFAEKSAGSFRDQQVRRSYVVRAERPEKEKEITAAIEAKVEEFRAENDRAWAIFREREMVGHANDVLKSNVGDLLGIGRFESRWKSDLDQLWSRRESVETELLDSGWAQDNRALEIRRLEEERLGVLQPATEYRASIVTKVAVPEDGEYTLIWDYSVPCALWRPQYTAELGEGDKPVVRWQSTGCVWQRTGEDWEGVELTFSTARPTLGATPPVLRDEVLEKRTKTEEEKKTIDVVSRDVEIADTRSATAAASIETPPGLDDGGEVRSYTASRRVDVPSDGRPHRIEFESWEADTDPEYACVPDQAPFVFLRSMQTNPSALPLLAGPVTLIRGGGFTGRSRIGYVAPQEAFALSWGSEDGIIVRGEGTRQHRTEGLRKQRVHSCTTRVHMSNQTDHRRRIRLVLRVPVSEIKQVEIEINRPNSTSGFEVDDQGRVTWMLDLDKAENKRIKLLFTVRMPNHVRWRD
ncbi:MAG: mucoidy inhibitor MuiA family protein [Planctomycetota bacterium]|nr:mucoidy inhibitor MuiA family protein [Planctomycetota bacterium]